MTTETINNTEISKMPLTFSSETESSLRSSAKWGFFLAIVGFVFVLLFLIIGISMFFVSGVANEYSDFQHMPFPFPFPLVFIGILYLLIAVIYFIPSYNLLIFGQKILSGISKRSQPDVEEGLKNLKRMFIFYGILTIIGLILSVFFIAIGFIAGMAANNL